MMPFMYFYSSFVSLLKIIISVYTTNKYKSRAHSQNEQELCRGVYFTNLNKSASKDLKKLLPVVPQNDSIILLVIHLNEKRLMRSARE